MRAKTIEMVQWIRDNPDMIARDFGIIFQCDPNNFHNIKRRYQKYIDNPELVLNLTEGKKQTNKQTKQTKIISSKPILTYSDVKKGLEMIIRYGTLRLIRKDDYNFLLEQWLYFASLTV